MMVKPKFAALSQGIVLNEKFMSGNLSSFFFKMALKLSEKMSEKIDFSKFHGTNGNRNRRKDKDDPGSFRLKTNFQTKNLSFKVSDF